MYSMGMGIICFAGLLTAVLCWSPYGKRTPERQSQRVAALLMEFQRRAATNNCRGFASDLAGTRPGEGWEMDAYSAGNFGAYVTWKNHRWPFPTHLTYHILQDQGLTNLWTLSETRSPVPSVVAGYWSKWVNAMSWMRSTKPLLSVTNRLVQTELGERISRKSD